MNLHLAKAEVVKRVTGAEVGYAGPVGLPEDVEVLWDLSCEGRVNFECGGNKTHFHNINVNFVDDVAMPSKFVDVREVKAGETCIKCGKGTLVEARTIELGHVFKLGTVYSEKMKAVFTDSDGKQKLIIMGCYGIGMTRALAASVEMSHDERGIIWSREIAPFTVHLISLPGGEDKAQDLYQKLWAQGVEVLWDDRDVAAGIKFADCDLIGLPYRLVVSQKTGDQVEVRRRSESTSVLMGFDEALGLMHG